MHLKIQDGAQNGRQNEYFGSQVINRDKLNILPFARDKKWGRTRMITLAVWRWVTNSDATFTVDIIVLRSKMASEMTVN